MAILTNYGILYFDKMFKQIHPCDCKFYSTFFKTKGLKIKETLFSWLTHFIKPRSNSILVVSKYTVNGDSCYTFSRFPESKSPVKYTLMLFDKKYVLHDLLPNCAAGSFSMHNKKLTNITLLFIISFWKLLNSYLFKYKGLNFRQIFLLSNTKVCPNS